MDLRKDFIHQLWRYKSGSISRRHFMGATGLGVATVAFDLLPVSYLFRRGHRIRLSISGGDPDHFRRMTEPVPFLRVFHGANAASRLDLPVDTSKR